MTDRAMIESFERRECALSGEDYMAGSFVKKDGLYNYWETQQRFEDYQAGYMEACAHTREEIIRALSEAYDNCATKEQEITISYCMNIIRNLSQPTKG